MGNIGRTLVSPISTSLGRVATMGATGAVLNAAAKGRKRASTATPATSFAPNPALRNSSLYNSMAGG